MFTGIIQERATVDSFSGGVLAVRSNFDHVIIGESIAINGVCLTVRTYEKRVKLISFDVMPQTLKLTNLGILRAGNKVNMERAARLGDSMGGHFVSGHIDEKGEIKTRKVKGNALLLGVKTLPQNSLYIIPQGSIAIDGVSLTIAAKDTDGFSVSLIPQTLRETTLGLKKAGDSVNIEYDQIVKITVETVRHSMGKKEKITFELLKEKGFV